MTAGQPGTPSLFEDGQGRPMQHREPRVPYPSSRPPMWPADRIGDQLHIGAARLRRATFIPARNHDDPASTKPQGGMWTATLRDGPRSAFTDRVRGDGLWWVLEPAPRARILIINIPADWEAIVARFSRTDGQGPDFERIAAYGVAGVHLTECGARDVPALAEWEGESTVWLRWAFVLDPPICIPRGPRRIPKRADLTGPYRGAWIIWNEPTDAYVAAMRRAAEKHAITKDDMLAMARAMLDTMVVDHCFLYSVTREKLPVGAGFFDALMARDPNAVLAVVFSLQTLLG